MPSCPAEQVGEQAARRAARAGRTELVEPFTRTAPIAVAAARDIDFHRLVDYLGLAVIPLGEAARVMLLEAVVHYLDLADALVLPRASSRIGTGPLLRVAGLLAATADPVEFIEAATGRTRTPVLPVLR